MEEKEAEGLKIVSVLLPESYLEGLHELVRMGMYPCRSAVIRAAVRDMLKRELWLERVKEKKRRGVRRSSR